MEDSSPVTLKEALAKIEELEKKLGEAHNGLAKTQAASMRLQALASEALTRSEGLQQELAKVVAAKNEESQKVAAVKDSEDYGRFTEEAKSLRAKRDEAVESFRALSEEREMFLHRETLRLTQASGSFLEMSADALISDLRSQLKALADYEPFKQQANGWLRERLRAVKDEVRQEKEKLAEARHEMQLLRERYRAALDKLQDGVLEPLRVNAEELERGDESPFEYRTAREEAWSLAASILRSALADKKDVFSSELPPSALKLIVNEILPVMSDKSRMSYMKVAGAKKLRAVGH